MLLSTKWFVFVVTVVLASSEAVQSSTEEIQVPSFLSQVFQRFPKRQLDVGVCNSSVCQQDATEILESLDRTVDPCDDFYQFACGGWIEKHPATKETPHLSHYSEVTPEMMAAIHLTLEEPVTEDDISPLKSAKKMYKACMDVETIERVGLQPLVELLREIGWPMALEDWNGENLSLDAFLSEYDRHVGVHPLFYTSADTYSANISRLYIHINGPEIGLSKSELLSPWEEETRTSFKNLIANISLELLNASNVVIDEESVVLQATEILEFMIQLQNISYEMSEVGENMTLKDLQEWTDSALVVHPYAKFNWLRYLNKILSGTGIVLGEDEDVIVLDRNYLRNLVKLLDDTPPRVTANYLFWTIINLLKDETTQRMQELTLNYEKESRTKYCSKKIMARYNHVINSIVIPKHLSENEMDYFRFFVLSMILEIKNQIASVEWLDDDGRSQFIEGLTALSVVTRYPTYLFNDTSELSNYYKQVNVSDSHFMNMISLTPKLYTNSLPLLRDEFNVNEKVWLGSRLEKPNAFFFNHENAVVIPYGLLQHHFFNHDRLKSLNYGRIGNTIGHEFMHGMSAFYDSHYWNDNTSDTVMTNRECFIYQYDKYHIPELEALTDTNVTVSGEKTLWENISDTIGVYTAYKTYQAYVKQHGTEPSLPGLEEFSQDQLFFIGYATAECESRNIGSMVEAHFEDHAPMFARVRGAVSNLKEFATAFNCSARSNMNPRNKCRMW